MFSLFGRKDKAASRRVRDGRPVRVPDDTLRGPTIPASAEAQREIARRTAAKIDQIESEMIDGAPPAITSGPHTLPMTPRPGISAALGAAGTVAMPRRPAATGQAAAAPGAPASALAAAGVDARAPAPALAPLEFTTSVVLGDTFACAGGIQVAESQLAPELEEAAILFANAQPQAAAATLKAAIARGHLDAGAQRAWLMLLDVLQSEGARAEFESTAIDFAARFEKSPPAWQDVTVEAPPPRAIGATTTFKLPARLEASAARIFEQARRLAASGKAVTVDASAIDEFDADGAALVAGMLRDFEASGAELVVLGAGRLFEVARASIEPGRRDPSEAGWKLALAALRLLGEKQAFDDLAIDYCVTYEVSPPSWEAVPAKIRTAPMARTVKTPKAGAPTSSVEGGAFSLNGEIAGRMAEELAALRGFGAERSDVVVDCRTLRRLDFVAAGELLNEVVQLASRRKSVLFVEPSAIVEALLVVMGIHEVAEIRRRRI